MADFQRNKVYMRTVGAWRLSVGLQSAVINLRAKQLAQALKLRLRRIWPAPLELRAEEPRKWWNLLATAGLKGRASDDAWARLIPDIQEILIFDPIMSLRSAKSLPSIRSGRFAWPNGPEIVGNC